LPTINTDCQNNEEKTCWLENKITVLNIGDNKNFSFKAFSPWPNQKLLAFDAKLNLLETFAITNSYTEFKISNLNTDKIIFLTTQIHSPILYGLSNDNRRLGIALKEFDLN
jgi:hypothetical protein